MRWLASRQMQPLRLISQFHFSEIWNCWGRNCPGPDAVCVLLCRYVQCYNCGNPETVIKIRKDLINLKCKACGFVSDVDMRHKLNTYILKNPPEEKVSKAEKKCAVISSLSLIFPGSCLNTSASVDAYIVFLTSHVREKFYSLLDLILASVSFCPQLRTSRGIKKSCTQGFTGLWVMLVV